MTQKVETHMTETQDLNRKIPTEKRPNPLFIITRSNVIAWFFSALIFGGFLFFVGVLVGRDTAPITFDIQKISDIPQSYIKEIENKKPEIDSFQIPSSDILSELQDRHLNANPKKETNAPEHTTSELLQINTEEVATKSPRVPSKKNQNFAASESHTQKRQILTPSLPQKIMEKAMATKPVGMSESLKAIRPGVIKYVIQVTSLNDLNGAAMIRDKLIAKGYPAFCRSTDIKGKVWHRVRIGPYYEKSIAQKDCARLKEGGMDALLIFME